MNKNGISLVELSVVMLIFAIALAALWGFLHVSYSANMRETMITDLQTSKMALDRLVRETRGAYAGSMTITVIDASSDKISFRTPASDANIQYYREGLQLVRESPPGTKKVIADNISFLKFSRTGRLLTIEVGASQPFYGEDSTFHYLEKVRIRNG